jgi:hypothetical protein
VRKRAVLTTSAGSPTWTMSWQISTNTAIFESDDALSKERLLYKIGVVGSSKINSIRTDDQYLFSDVSTYHRTRT